MPETTAMDNRRRLQKHEPTTSGTESKQTNFDPKMPINENKSTHQAELNGPKRKSPVKTTNNLIKSARIPTPVTVAEKKGADEDLTELFEAISAHVQYPARVAVSELRNNLWASEKLSKYSAHLTDNETLCNAISLFPDRFKLLGSGECLSLSPTLTIHSIDTKDWPLLFELNFRRSIWPCAR